MELTILQNIPRSGFFDSVFLFLSKIGTYGLVWLAAGIVLLFFKQTRRAGAGVLIGCVGVLLFGELLLKHVVTRVRPCEVDQTFRLLVERPTSSSFPSTHSAFAFAAATAIFMNHKKSGIAVFVAALLVSFSRLYLFLHYPTDVLAGAALGVIMGIAGVKIYDFARKKLQKAPQT